ncbi:mRNA-binding ribosome synthesis protein nop7, partial [Cladochytrium tenue]
MEALKDLDDALCLVFLFSTLPRVGLVKSEHIAKCHRLASEFQHYVMASRSLRKAFVSIKGIYYQASIRGQDVTWVVPHAFSQDRPHDVDFRVMGTFLEIYETLVRFVNLRLYKELNLVYPPAIDKEREDGAAGLAAFVIESTAEIVNRVAAEDKDSGANGTATNAKGKLLKSLAKKIATLDPALAGSGTDADEDAANDGAEATDADSGVPQPVAAPVDASERLPALQDDSVVFEPTAVDDDARMASGSNHATLFAGLVFFLSREVPRAPLEFVIRSCGGTVGWEPTSGAGSPFSATDARITHMVVDRTGSPPPPPPGADPAAWARREFLQPQWVFDSLNAAKLLRTRGYHPGEELPAHLSPFVQKDALGLAYVPPEAKAVEATDGANGVEGDADAAEDVSESEGEDDLDDEEESGEDEAVYEAELKAESAGLTLSEYLTKNSGEAAAAAAAANSDEKKKKKSPADTAAARRQRAAAKERAEEVELAKSVMSRKARDLYDRVDYSRKRRLEE